MPAHQRSIEELIKTIKTLDSKLAQSEGKSADLKITLGLTLAEAKLANKNSKSPMPWPEFLEKHFANLKRLRADELIQIGEGRKTDEEVRSTTAARVQKHATKPPLANGGSPRSIAAVTKAPNVTADVMSAADRAEATSAAAKQPKLDAAAS